MGRKNSGAKVLETLVLKVSHVAMDHCRNEAEFRQAVKVLVGNLRETMGALAGFQPSRPQARRVAENLKLKAVRLLELCNLVPSSFDDPDAWREVAAQIMANYEQFRSEAGHLYLLEFPCAGFDVLGAAL